MAKYRSTAMAHRMDIPAEPKKSMEKEKKWHSSTPPGQRLATYVAITTGLVKHVPSRSVMAIPHTRMHSTTMAMRFPRTPTANMVAEVTRDLDSSRSAGKALWLWLRARGGKGAEIFVSKSPKASSNSVFVSRCAPMKVCLLCLHRSVLLVFKLCADVWRMTCGMHPITVLLLLQPAKLITPGAEAHLLSLHYSMMNVQTQDPLLLRELIQRVALEKVAAMLSGEDGAQLQCCLTVEQLNSSGETNRRQVFRKASILLGRNEFQE
ncbi:hypothetical protein F7725_011690 [Dissostichus mawsoni]|uniref:Uncharacterized protein n=1 Tax=Dissostichus mawsoni TaxID=36200 RepID=A0A7J5ZBN5_DISMA|nr:hypothetical protein F7725_011690 [Dissostichus mawsoni]